MSEAAQLAAASGAEYLLRGQAEDGHWEEYHLPTGASDAWITAYVGLALVVASERGIGGGARAAAVRAARWLSVNRQYPSGWGYNGSTGPDSDSTALALTLVRAMGLPARPSDEKWLRARWQPGGGFATYDGPEAWGTAHVDVTPAAYLALGAAGREELREELIAYLLRQRLPDGTWPAYWWRSNLYSTHACLELLRDLDVSDLLVRPSVAGTIAIQSDFELALAIEIAMLCGGPVGIASAWAQKLATHQLPNGSWRGDENLRVTDPSCYAPWERPQGKLYRDDRGLLTTAAAVRALARLSG
jgi:hypothetical protein